MSLLENPKDAETWRKVALKRSEEAQVLQAASHTSISLYLMCYALECSLKGLYFVKNNNFHKIHKLSDLYKNIKPYIKDHYSSSINNISVVFEIRSKDLEGEIKEDFTILRYQEDFEFSSISNQELIKKIIKEVDTLCNYIESKSTNRKKRRGSIYGR